jgi:hypothetical protein
LPERLLTIPVVAGGIAIILALIYWVARSDKKDKAVAVAVTAEVTEKE